MDPFQHQLTDFVSSTEPLFQPLYEQEEDEVSISSSLLVDNSSTGREGGGVLRNGACQKTLTNNYRIYDQLLQIIEEDLSNFRSIEHCWQGNHEDKANNLQPVPIHPYGNNIVVVPEISNFNDSKNLFDLGFARDLALLLSSPEDDETPQMIMMNSTYKNGVEDLEKNDDVLMKNFHQSQKKRAHLNECQRKISTYDIKDEKIQDDEDGDHSLFSLNNLELHGDFNIIDSQLMFPASKKQKTGGNLDGASSSPSFTSGYCFSSQGLVSSFSSCMDDTTNTQQQEEEEARIQDLKNTDNYLSERRLEKWETRFQDLIRYKQIHGNCCVPNFFPENPKLAQWVKRQRYQHKLKMEGKHCTLTPKRMKALEAIGFVWDSQETAWMTRWEELKDFYIKNGNSNVPSTYEENRHLSIWVKCQRRQYKLFQTGRPSSMTFDRIAKMEALNFNWNPRNL